MDLESTAFGSPKDVPERMPYVGETVLFCPNPGDSVAKSNYNDEDIPAIVTRVWSYGCVNMKIIPDCGAMQDRTSVVHQSLNRAGYHFRFIGEKKMPPMKSVQSSEESSDASAFLKQ